MNIRAVAFFTLLVGGFLLAMVSPLLFMRSTIWIYVLVPLFAVYTLWLMRVWQLWVRRGRRPW